MTRARGNNSIRWIIAALIWTAAMLLGSMNMVFADDGGTIPEDQQINMVEGQVIQGFVEAGTESESMDPAVAWIDESGDLNALKTGTTIITTAAADSSRTYEITVGDYSDGSEVVGRLKILARYNDSMQFYDGHTYLLFTSYQDGVDIEVDDLYGGYEISDQYYRDIREDIANGSNHTGSDADKYFTFDPDMKKVTLDRGEIVTIGMYRGFDLTVEQAALGSLKNSTVWTQLKKAGKTSAVETIFRMLEAQKIPEEDAITSLITIFNTAGADYQNWMDGVVEGGVAFNRELYNQKLEWDQYENVDYELDITRNQLNTLVAYLSGNHNKFSMLGNSCATVAFRAWNAALGTRDGQQTAYYLDIKGKGIFSIIDAPKGARDAIVSRLPGYYLNNAEGVAEPDAGFEDETGGVYVSAPELVSPLVCSYGGDDSIIIDQSRTKLASVINSAKAGIPVSYNIDEQEIGVSVIKNTENEFTTVSGIGFDVNGVEFTAAGERMPEDGIWLSVNAENPSAGNRYYVTDAQGNILPSEFENGRVSFHTDSLPVSFRIVGDGEAAFNVLKTQIINPDDVDVETEIFQCDGGEEKAIGERAELAGGTMVYVRPAFASMEKGILASITMNGEEILDDAHYDADKKAYGVAMPLKYSKLRVTYSDAAMNALKHSTVQVSVGDEMDVAEYAELTAGDKKLDPKYIRWFTLDELDELDELDLGEEAGVVELTEGGRVLQAKKPGDALIFAIAKDNFNLEAYFLVEVHEDLSAEPQIIFDESDADKMEIGTGALFGSVPYSGYRVAKGTEITVKPKQEESKVVSGLTCNGTKLKPGEKYTVNEDTTVDISFRKAVVKGVPETAELAEKGDCFKINAKVRYSGIFSLLPVYDPEIRFKSSDPELLEVNEEGLLTVKGDIPEGGKAVIVTACAGSSNDKVFSKCKVILGDYQGNRIVGKLTIYARPIQKMQLIAHSSTAFTAYEDMDLSVSYHDRILPKKEYYDLLAEYDSHPGQYKSDPAVYNNNDWGLEDRTSYFDREVKSAGSEPGTVSVKAGECITITNYGDDPTSLITALRAFENGRIASTESAAILIEQANRFVNNEEIDGEKAFDSLIETMVTAYQTMMTTGENLIDGHSDGGMSVDREIRNQFRRQVDSQTPNVYYQVEITADELAQMEAYLADPANNYYSIFTKNCTSGAVDIWNAALQDRPQFLLKGNYSGLTDDPMSLYVELSLMGLKKDLGGKGGKNFYPRSVLPAEVQPVEPPAQDEGKAIEDEGKAAGDQGQKASKKNNSLKVKARKKGVTLKYSKVRKKAQTVAIGKLATISKAKGKTTFKKLSANRNSGNFKIDSKTNKIIVKKGTKKGLYKVKIRVKAAGNSSFKPAVKNVTVKIRIR